MLVRVRRPDPLAAIPVADPAAEDDLTDDALTRDFRIWQRRRGHRYSIDDVATAWEALEACPRAGRAIDLGCGIGSVLLMLAWGLPRARLVGVEALELSAALAARNVRRNRVEERVRVVPGDLRDPALRRTLLEDAGPFDLVTGTPPYFPPGSATPSPDPQRAHARVELRGGVEAYLEAAAHLLGAGGVVALCAAARADQRVEAAALRNRLRPRSLRPVLPRAGPGRVPLFTVWTFTRDGPGLDAGSAAAGSVPDELAPRPLLRHPPLVARDEAGRRTEAERALRGYFGLASRREEPPSP